MSSDVLLLNLYYDYPTVTEGIFSGVNKIWQPISLAYAKAMLKSCGIEATLLDANAERLKPAHCGERARGKRIVFVSTSSYDRWECPHLDLKPAVETCASIRANDKDIKIILVGSHGSVRTKIMLEMTGADAAIIDEPENAIVAACKAKDLHESLSLAWIDDTGALKTNPHADPVELDSLPSPDFSDLPMEVYNFDMIGYRFAVIETSRGCPFKCNYCLKTMFGGYRRKSLENSKRDIMRLVTEYDVRNINFVDLEFTLDRDYTIALCDWMVKEELKLRWVCQTRLDTVDDEMLKAMKKAGCSMIMYGVESADQKMLDSIGKNIDLDKIHTGIKATKKAGIDSLCFFMYGFPGDEPKDWERTVDLAITLNPDYASFFLCRPYPGTECYDMSKEINDGNFPLGVGDSERLYQLKEFTDKAFARFYFRPSFIISRLLKGDISLIINQMRLFFHKRGWLGDG